jgi:phosphatidylglycerol lysyltransferase
VAFHRVGSFAITVGAPLGPEEDVAQANAAFRQHCRSKGWSPVMFQAAAPVEGLRSHLIAREAFIDVGDFSLSGSAMANARHSVSRARRDGMTVSWQRWSECDLETRAEMKLISDSWSGGRPELTFTYGRLRDITDDAWSASRSPPVAASRRFQPGGRSLQGRAWYST